MRRNIFYTHVFNLLFVKILYIYAKNFKKILQSNKFKNTKIYLKCVIQKFLICIYEIYFVEKYIEYIQKKLHKIIMNIYAMNLFISRGIRSIS